MSGSFKHAGASVARIPQAVLWGSKWLKNEENRGDDNVNFGPDPENNKALDGCQAWEVFIVTHVSY